MRHWTYVELRTALAISGVEGEDLETQEIIAVLNAGRNLGLLDTTGGNLQAIISKTSGSVSIWEERQKDSFKSI